MVILYLSRGEVRGQEPNGPRKKIIKKLKKPLDKQNPMCYNKDTVKERRTQDAKRTADVSPLN
jgi:hypothetical protein